MELTHANVVAQARQAQAVLGLTEADVVVGVAPFFHAIGQNLILPCSLRAGATVVTMPRFDLAGFLELIQRYRATSTIVVPPVVLALAGHPLVDDYDLSSLRFLGCGAAPLGAEVEQRCADRLGCQVAQGFGMTEGTAAFAIAPPEEPRRGSAGRLLPSTQARIVDPGGGDLGPGRTGELWLRGPQVMRGYRNHPEATAATLGPGGWLRTGDLCYFDADGYLFVVDRLKELIKYKGYQVAPAELEQLLCAHPAVADAAVVPRPDPVAGELPVAHVARRAEVGAAELEAWVADRVAPYKRLRGVQFVDQVPRSPTGKLLRAGPGRGRAGRGRRGRLAPGPLPAVAAGPGEQAVGVAGVDHQVGGDAAGEGALAAAELPVELAGGVGVGVDRDQAAGLDGQAQQALGRVLALGPGVDLDGDAAGGAGGEHRLGVELALGPAPADHDPAGAVAEDVGVGVGHGRDHPPGHLRAEACAAWSGRWPPRRRAGPAARRSGRACRPRGCRPRSR